LLNIRAENATFNGILIGSVVMTEILVWGLLLPLLLLLLLLLLPSPPPLGCSSRLDE
jgi:hypothetical protein